MIVPWHIGAHGSGSSPAGHNKKCHVKVSGSSHGQNFLFQFPIFNADLRPGNWQNFKPHMSHSSVALLEECRGGGSLQSTMAVRKSYSSALQSHSKQRCSAPNTMTSWLHFAFKCDLLPTLRLNATFAFLFTDDYARVQKEGRAFGISSHPCILSLLFLWKSEGKWMQRDGVIVQNFRFKMPMNRNWLKKEKNRRFMAIFKKILNFFNGVQNFSIEHYMTMSAIGAVIFIRNLSTSTHYMQRE